MSVITSPAFPLDYAHNLDCIWNITAPDDRIIAVKYASYFEKMQILDTGWKYSCRYEVLELEASIDCLFDSVELIDGADLNGTSMGKVCGGKEQLVSF